MKELSNGRRARLVAAAILMGFVSAAEAGPRYNVPGVVRIAEDGQGGWVVEGTLGEVRNSSNNAHYISCTQTRSEVLNPGGLISRTLRVNCAASNAERSVMCMSNSEAVANALSGAGSDALLQFHVVGVTCTDVIVYESSGTIRKAA
jgi:hypothetical protein